MKYYDSMGFESPDGIWARRSDVVDIEYSIKLQRLIGIYRLNKYISSLEAQL
jgi:hypothetical protein